MRADRMAAARCADAEAAEVRDLAEVDIRVAISEVRAVTVLRQQGAVDDSGLLDIFPSARPVRFAFVYDVLMRQSPV